MKAQKIRLVIWVVMVLMSMSHVGLSRDNGKLRTTRNKIKDNELPVAHKGSKDLVFLVQVSEGALPDEEVMKHGPNLGGIEKVKFKDGVVRYVAGGAFRSLERAQFHMQRVHAGLRRKVELVSLYKGKKISMADLEKMRFL